MRSRGARHGFLFVVLIYLALDLTHASIPGAFSFDPDACTEAVGGERGRTVVGATPALALGPHTIVPAVVVVDYRPVRRDGPAPPPPRHRPVKRPATHDRSSPTDDH